jgi:glycosyltransferase involved in cell wall biosynthesis
VTDRAGLDASTPSLRVGLFTEVFHPIVNGVVASVDALRDGLQRAGIDVVTFAPRAHAYDDRDERVVRFPSLPLPTTTGYRLCVPYLRERERARMRSLDVVHAHSPFVSGWTAFAHARRAHVPLVFTYHTQLEAYAHYAPFDARVTRASMIALTRAFANRADATIAPTHAMARRLRELGVTSRIDVVPSAIDGERFGAGRRNATTRALLGAIGDDPLVLVVARLGREKNVELAIDAMPFVGANARLAIVGDGPLRDALQRRIADRGLGARVRLTGAIATAAMPDVYASADALAFTSVTDTQGLVLSEAQAAGLPVVAVDSPVAREVLAEAGRFVAGDPRAVAAALAAALRAVPARPTADVRRFGRDGHCAAVRRIYGSLIGERIAETA